MTIAALPALEGVALNIAITKVVPLFAGYVPGKELADESVIRGYIRTLNSNARNSLSTLRTGLHQADRLDDWNTLEGALLKIDEFDSSLRTSLTGDLVKSLKGTSGIPKDRIDSLMTQDMRIMEQTKIVESECQKLLEQGLLLDSEELSTCTQSIISTLNRAVSMINERRVILNGLPLSMITGDSSQKEFPRKIILGLVSLSIMGLVLAWSRGLLG